MIATVPVAAAWGLAAIAQAAGATSVDDFWYTPNDDGTGTGALAVVDVSQEALDAALTAWLEANPQ
jgi:hypothetical protein